MSTKPLQVNEATAAYLAQASADDVPPGYKRTEVGVIPEDWDITSIFEIAGESKQRFDDGDWIEAEFLTDTGVRLLQTGNIGVGSFLDKESKKYISPASFDALRCKEVRPGDLLICRLAEPAGRACLVPDVGETRMITAVDVTIFRPVPDVADARYLVHVFCTPQWFAEVADHCGGSTRSRIARSQLARIKIPLPSLREQRAIAEALSDVDALIAALDKLIAKKRAIKQAAMQQLLTGKTRLPGFSGPWETKRLGEIAEVDPENLPSNTNPEYRFNYISLEQVDAGRLVGYTEEILRTAPSRARRVLRRGDVLMATVRPNLMAHLHYVAEIPNAVCSTGFAVLRAKPQVADAGFLCAHLFCYVVNKQIEKIIAGSNYPSINSGDVKAIEIPCPPTLEEQTAIASVLADMDADIAALEARRDKVKQIKQGMMQQLLTGRIRLVKPQRDAAKQ